MSAKTCPNEASTNKATDALLDSLDAALPYIADAIIEAAKRKLAKNSTEIH